jgi:phosphoribosylformimino-5-aminoimidazole carboxamide ribotide isomerase
VEKKLKSFTIFPAIDLLHGQVVRLSEGDPRRQSVYSAEPAETARQFISAGAKWLHVVNLDGAFGLEGNENMNALRMILKTATETCALVQFGGGVRSIESVDRAFSLGVHRVVLGTAIIETPELLDEALSRWGAERVAAGLDARDGLLCVRGWQSSTNLRAEDVAARLRARGLIHLVYTDIARDGLQVGVNLDSTVALARGSGLEVIASGGVASMADINQARKCGLAGVIVGRAIYENALRLDVLFQPESDPQRNVKRLT